MKEIFYNIWHTIDNRWTDSPRAATRSYIPKPIPLSYDYARWLCNDLNTSYGLTIFEVREFKEFKPSKVIPDFPMDPTLHILEAGYIQDRMRKRS